MDTARYDRAIAAIDAANADDPVTLVLDGEERPKELVHAELMTRWVRHLDPDVDELRLIAARAHHLRRWTRPRSDYPEGRRGYLRWRADAKRQHAEEVGAILADEGYTDDEIERVRRIVRKDGLRNDPAVQTHEDALCLVFLQTQLEETADRIGHEKTVEVLRKTLGKMSPAGIETSRTLELTPTELGLLESAADEPGSDR